MTSLVPESWAYNINGDDNSGGVEVSKIYTSLLMSLLEESNGEEYNDEQLNRVIQSLEAEINEQNIVECRDSDEGDGQNSLVSMDFGWGDIDNIELMVHSSLREDMNWSNNYTEFDMVEYDNSVSDYSEIHKVVPSLEEHSFSSLWDTAV